MSISDHLLAEAKRVAAATGRTLGQVVEDALRESFARSGRLERAPFHVPTFRGQGVHPGVDLDDSAGLQELMDQTAGLDRLR